MSAVDHHASIEIAVNLLWCVPGAVGGSEQYLARQLLTIADDPDFVITVYGPQGFGAAHRELVGALHAVVDGPGDGRNRIRRILAESTWLPRRTRHADLVHHGGGTLPTIRPGRRTVLTIHDLQYVTYPGTFSSSKLRYLRFTVPRALERADVVCCPSEFVRRTVLEVVPHRDPYSVVVVPHPIPVTELTGAELTSAAITSEATIRERYALTGPYAVYPAITYRHKNHAVLIEALPSIVAAHSGFRLVLIGGVGPMEAELTQRIAELGMTDSVVRPGRVSDADRNGLIAHASALTFPSRYEGFGAPLVEAMHLGAPIIAADVTAVGEVVADGGVVLSAQDIDRPEAWAAAVIDLIEHPERAAQLRVAGAQRAAHFDGVSTAEALTLAYRRALS
ncbi:MAG: glycosyltransferase family 4 protein [Acidimicrobiia bacterium]